MREREREREKVAIQIPEQKFNCIVSTGNPSSYRGKERKEERKTHAWKMKREQRRGIKNSIAQRFGLEGLSLSLSHTHTHTHTLSLSLSPHPSLSVYLSSSYFSLLISLLPHNLSLSSSFFKIRYFPLWKFSHLFNLLRISTSFSSIMEYCIELLNKALTQA